MLLEYIPILVWICLTAGLTAAILVFSHLVGRKRPSAEKLSPYECGIVPSGDARTRIPVKFYMVAMVFLIFDIEAAFLYPWAVVYRKMLLVGLLEMGLFMLILLISVGYLIVPGSQLMPTMPTELTGQTTQDPLSGQIQRIISIQIPSGRR